MRFYTVPSAQQARKSVVWAMILIGSFYIMTTFLGFGAATLVGNKQIGVRVSDTAANCASMPLDQVAKADGCKATAAIVKLEQTGKEADAKKAAGLRKQLADTATSCRPSTRTWPRRSSPKRSAARSSSRSSRPSPSPRSSRSSPA